MLPGLIRILSTAGRPDRRDRVETGQRHPVVVVNIGDQRDLDPVADQLGRLDVFFLGHGHADDLAARLFQSQDLRQRLLDVEGVGRRHRLHPDRVFAADDVITDTHFPRLVPLDRCRISHRWYVLWFR